MSDQANPLRLLELPDLLDRAQRRARALGRIAERHNPRVTHLSIPKADLDELADLVGELKERLGLAAGVVAAHVPASAVALGLHTGPSGGAA